MLRYKAIPDPVVQAGILANLPELVRLAATRKYAPASQRGDHANVWPVLTVLKGRQHDRPVPLAALRQALRPCTTMDTEAHATAIGITSHLNQCRWLFGAPAANTRRAP